MNTTSGATGPLPDDAATCKSYKSTGYTSFYGAGLLNAYAAANSVKVLPLLWKVLPA